MGAVAETKTCATCGRALPATAEFFNHHGEKRRPWLKWSGSCKECKNESRRKRYAEDPTPSRERWRRWYANNREYDKQRALAWRDAHPGRSAERAREYYEQHRDAELARGKEWRKANRDRYLATINKWRLEHPQQYRESVSNQSRNRRAASGHHTPADVRAQYERQLGCCYWCGAKVGDGYHVDHVVPIKLGGSNSPENIVVSCPPCNRAKHAKHPMDFAGVMF